MDWALERGSADPEEELVPRVRQELSLYPGEPDVDGSKVWILHDPLSNRFFQLGEREVEALAFVDHGNAGEVAVKIKQATGQDVSEESIKELIKFLRLNNLVESDETQEKWFEKQLAARSPGWFARITRTPLFFRIPLWKPDSFLDKTLKYFLWLGSTPALIGFALVGFLGLYLVSRQLDQFVNTFVHFFNLSGLALYMVVIAVVKVCHELGHAYVAKAMGCRVPVIGVAFLVGWPVLYTDTSDAWKIPNSKRRLRIDLAGVSVELVIAALSLFLWSLAPEGAVRSVLFMLATTTWVMSILVNFNPLMRFDGYYTLSDLLKFPNLEKRSFDLARWWLREKLFAPGIAAPERPRNWMIGFAFTVWIYRFFLYTGIALIVYHFFFKAAGITLFFLEIGYFIVRPIFNEVAEWKKILKSFNFATMRTLAVLVGIMLTVLVPWKTNVELPAIRTARYSEIFIPVSAQISELHIRNGDQVEKGDTLLDLYSPRLTHEIETVSHRYDELKWLSSSMGFNSQLRGEMLVVSSELATQNQRLRSLQNRREQLRIKAHHSGKIVDLSPDMSTGDWVPIGMKLMAIVDYKEQHIYAYAEEQELANVNVGVVGKFYPENPEFGVVAVNVVKIQTFGVTELDSLYQASLFGGDVAVREDNKGELLTVNSVYKIELETLEELGDGDRVIRGSVVVDGKPRSLMSKFTRRLMALLVRESGM
jgi:putative peptide zinc metalloprotease protein